MENYEFSRGRRGTLSTPPPSPTARSGPVFRCCTSDCDRRFLLFLTTFVLTVVVAGFSMYMLVHVDKCDNDIYVSLLTMTLSVWFPSPSAVAKHNNLQGRSIT